MTKKICHCSGKLCNGDKSVWFLVLHRRSVQDSESMAPCDLCRYDIKYELTPYPPSAKHYIVYVNALMSEEHTICGMLSRARV